MTDCIQYFVDFGFIDKIDNNIEDLKNDNSKQIISNDDFLILKTDKIMLYLLEKN